MSGDRPSIVVKGEAWRVCPECGVRLLARRCPKCKTTSIPALLLEGGSVAEPVVGMMLGDQYELLELLGEGGMGKVFRAVQLSMDRDVAVKIISHEISCDLDSIRRFQREAKVTSRLSHPHSIRVFDFGITDDGLFYLAMELLRGRELAVEIQNLGAMPIQRALDIAIQVLSALKEAHGLGIVHRDLKPTNIFLRSAAGEADFVKVMDFGIAKASFAEEYQRVTRTGTIVGTPKYMSPEQARGRSADARSDIYAMGIILHEMLTGSAPFEHESPVQVLLKHTMEPTPRLAGLKPDLVEVVRVQALVDRLVAKEPAQRPESVVEAAAELQALLDSLGPAHLSLPPAQEDAPTLQADVVPNVTPPYISLPDGSGLAGPARAADEVETGPVDLPGGFAARSGDRATFVGVAIPVPVVAEQAEPEEEEEQRATAAFSTVAVQEQVAATESAPAAAEDAAPKPAVVLDPKRIRPIEPPAQNDTVLLSVPVEALDMSSRETIALDVAKVNAATLATVVGPAPSAEGKRTSRWPFVVAGLLVVSAVGGAIAYGALASSPEPAESVAKEPAVAPVLAPEPPEAESPAVEAPAVAPPEEAEVPEEKPAVDAGPTTQAADAAVAPAVEKTARRPSSKRTRKKRRRRRKKPKARSPYLMD